MKKILIATVLCFGWGMSIKAQVEGKMLKTMLQQIAALQAYIKVAEKGYQIAEDGLHTIGDIKNGEFNLHGIFFSSLKTVSSSVKNAAEVAEIIALQISIAQQFSKSVQRYQQTGVLRGDELTYIGKVYSNLLSEGIKDIDALTTILTDGQLEMDDGERLNRIQGIDTDMHAQYGFMKKFTGQTDLLVMQRTRDGSDAGTVRQLYGIDIK